MAEKEAEGIAEKRSEARGPENVWGSALTGALCALGTLVVPVEVETGLITSLLLGYVASFSTKLSDTCASEGESLRQADVLITTLQPVSRGTEGAVSPRDSWLVASQLRSPWLVGGESDRPARK